MYVANTQGLHQNWLGVQHIIIRYGRLLCVDSEVRSTYISHLFNILFMRYRKHNGKNYSNDWNIDTCNDYSDCT